MQAQKSRNFLYILFHLFRLCKGEKTNSLNSMLVLSTHQWLHMVCGCPSKVTWSRWASFADPAGCASQRGASSPGYAVEPLICCHVQPQHLSLLVCFSFSPAGLLSVIAGESENPAVVKRRQLYTLGIRMMLSRCLKCVDMLRVSERSEWLSDVICKFFSQCLQMLARRLRLCACGAERCWGGGGSRMCCRTLTVVVVLQCFASTVESAL